jgi:hypothetical protein
MIVGNLSLMSLIYNYIDELLAADGALSRLDSLIFVFAEKYSKVSCCIA